MNKKLLNGLLSYEVIRRFLNWTNFVVLIIFCQRKMVLFTIVKIVKIWNLNIMMSRWLTMLPQFFIKETSLKVSINIDNYYWRWNWKRFTYSYFLQYFFICSDFIILLCINKFLINYESVIAKRDNISKNM